MLFAEEIKSPKYPLIGFMYFFSVSLFSITVTTTFVGIKEVYFQLNSFSNTYYILYVFFWFEILD